MDLANGRCIECGDPLREIREGSGEWRQYQDAMDMALVPGYGEKIDGNAVIKFHFCDLCSDKFLAVFPNTRKRLEVNSMNTNLSHNENWKLN